MHSKIGHSGLSRLVVASGGALSVLVGLIVMAGWRLHNLTLIQISPGFAPMQFNTALAFALSGGGLLLIVAGWRRSAQIPGLLVNTIGVLTLAQYSSDWSLGLDELFVDSYLSVSAAHPGRMAPITASCFTLIGIALAIQAIRPLRWRGLILGLLGSIVTALSLVAFAGYFLGITTTLGWGQFTHVAIHAAGSLIVSGAAILCLAWEEITAQGVQARQGMIIPLGVGILTATLFLWQALRSNETLQLQQGISATTADASSDVTTQLKLHLKALTRVAKRWEFSGGTSLEAWKADVEHYLVDFSGYHEIQWVDADYRIRWLMKLKGLEVLERDDPRSKSLPRETLESAYARRGPAVSQTIELREGGQGFLVSVPIFGRNGFDGFIVGVFRLGEVFRTLLEDRITDHYLAAVFDGSKEVYRFDQDDAPPDSSLFGDAELDLDGAKWRIRLWPRAELVAALHTQLPTLTLLVGLLMDAFLLKLLGLAQTARRREKEAEVANQKLQIEIGERQWVEEILKNALIKSEEYSRLFELSVDLICVADFQGYFRHLNPAWESTLGYTEKELLSEPYIKLIHPDDLEQTRAESARLHERGQVSSGFVNRFRCKDGGYRWFSWSASPNHDARLIYAVVRDITEQRRSEEALRQSEEKYRELFDTASDLIFTNGPDGRFLYVNRAWMETLGYHESEVAGLSVFNIIHPDYHHHCREIFRYIATGGRINEIEAEFVSKDGRRVSVEWSVNCKYEDQGVVQTRNICRDVTKRKLAELEMIRAKETAEAANRAKSEFLANMSHEIRTPMNGIIGMTELALETELTARQQKYLRRVKVSADSLLSLINDILDFSKIEAGKLELDPMGFNLRDLLEDIISVLEVRAQQKGLTLDWAVERDLPDLLVGDAGRLRQILINLIANGIKFTKQGGVHLGVATDSVTAREVVIRFSVHDTGIGIPPEKQQMIFHPFTQANGSTTREFGGTGLGLAIVSQLVGMMGGEVWVESEIGHGSIFHFTARFNRQDLLAATVIHNELVKMKGLKVLVLAPEVEGCPDFSTLLSNWQMQPEVVKDLETAVRSVKQAVDDDQPFALSLICAMGPFEDGFARARQLRQALAGVKLGILIAGAPERRADLARHRDLGITAYLDLPIESSELFNAIVLAVVPILQSDAHSPRNGAPAPREKAKNLKILVAEDNEINQELIIDLLEGRGHQVVVAGDGRTALDLFQQQRFDVVLMDVQMPIMGGFEAVAALREYERGTNARTPVIALTAHAINGDRERCLAAGMDDYLAKPLEPKKLFAVIEEVTVSTRSEVAEAPPKPAAIAAFDRESLMTRVGGKIELVKKIGEIFVDKYPRQLSEIRSAIADGDSQKLSNVAHALKGMLGNLSAMAAAEAAKDLELMGMADDLTRAGEVCEALEAEITRFRQALTGFLEQGQHSAGS